jgi:hypothetical protein
VAGDREHRRVVALDEGLEGPLVAGAQAREQLGLGCGGPVLDSGLGHLATLTGSGFASPAA